MFYPEEYHIVNVCVKPGETTLLEVNAGGASQCLSKVAQVSPAAAGLYRRASSLQVARISRSGSCRACRLEIGDTAGWKPVGNLRYNGDPAAQAAFPGTRPSALL